MNVVETELKILDEVKPNTPQNNNISGGFVDYIDVPNYHAEYKKPFDAPANITEDEAEYNFLVQIEGRDKSEFFGQSDLKKAEEINRLHNEFLKNLYPEQYEKGRGIFSQMGSAAAESGISFLQGLTSFAKMQFEDEYMIEDPKTGERRPITEEEKKTRRDWKWNEKIKNTLGDWNANMEDFKKRHELYKKPEDISLLYDITSGATSLLANIAIAAITQNPAAVMPTIFASSTGNAYEELRSKGYSPEYSKNVASLVGLSESALEAIGTDYLIKGIGGNTFIKRVIDGVITEGLQEAIQQASEETIMQSLGGREKEINQTIKDVLYAGMIGAIVGGGAGGITSSLQPAMEKGGVPKNIAQAVVNKFNENDGITLGTRILENQMKNTSFYGEDPDIAAKELKTALDTLNNKDFETEMNIKDSVNEMFVNANVSPEQADLLSEIMQKRAETASAALGITPKEWLESKKLKVINENPGANIGETLYQDLDNKRGAITFGDETLIRLGKNADASTALHELGHLFEQDFLDIVRTTNKEDLINDYQILREELGMGEDQTELLPEQREAFARAFEAYVREGKTPNSALQRVFEKFKEWLLSIYQNMKDLNVELSDSMRGFFDNLLGGYDVGFIEKVKDSYGTQLENLKKVAEGIKNNKWIEADDINPDTIESIINTAKRSVPKAESLFTFIRRRGGVWDERGELANRGLPKGIVRKNPKSSDKADAYFNTLDRTLENAIEMGYFREDATMNDLLSAIDDESKGQKLYKDDAMNAKMDAIEESKTEAERLLSEILESSQSPEEMAASIRKLRKENKQVKKEKSIQQATKEQITKTEKQLEELKKDTRGLEGKTKREIYDVQSKLTNIIMDSALAPEDKAKFMRTIKNIQTKWALEKILPEIESRMKSMLENSAKRNIKDLIYKELKSTKPIRQGARKVGKYDAETQKKFDNLRSISLLKQEEASKLYSSILEKITNNEYVPNEFDIFANKYLSIKAGRQYIGLDVFQDVLNGIVELKKTGRIANLEKAVKRIELKGQLAEDALNAIQGLKPVSLSTMAKKKKQGFTTSYSEQWVYDWNSFMEKIMDFKDTREAVINMIEDAEFEEMKLANKSSEDIQSIVVKTYGLKNSKQINSVLKRHAEKFKQENVLMADGKIEPTLTLSRGEIIDLYMQVQNPETKSFILSPEGNNLTEYTLDDFFQQLTAEDKALADRLFNYYEDYYNKVNAVYEDRYGISIPKIKMYVPRSRANYTIQQDLLEQTISQFSTIPSSTKARSKKISAVKITPALVRLDKHTNKSNKFISHQKALEFTQAIFNDENVQTAIKNKFGDETLSRINEHLKTFAQGRPYDTDAAMSKLMAGYSFLKTAGKINMIPKQFVSTLAYLEKMPIASYFAGVLDFITNPKAKIDIIKQSEFVKNRLNTGSFDRDLTLLINTENYSKYKRAQTLTNFMSLPIKLGDAFAIYVGGWSYYRHLIKTGMSQEQALQEFSRMSNRTQQSSSMSKLSLSQKGTTWERIITMFKSAPLQYMRKNISAFRALKRGEIGLPQFTKTMALYNVVMPYVFYLVASGFYPDDDEAVYNVITANASALPLLGDIINYTAGKLTGQKQYAYKFPFVSEGEDIVKGVLNFIQDEEVKAEEFFPALLEVASFAAGYPIPVKTLVNNVGGVYKLGDDEEYKGALQLMGWTAHTVDKIGE